MTATPAPSPCPSPPRSRPRSCRAATPTGTWSTCRRRANSGSISRPRRRSSISTPASGMPIIRWLPTGRAAPGPGGGLAGRFPLPRAGKYWIEAVDGNSDAESAQPFKLAVDFADSPRSLRAQRQPGCGGSASQHGHGHAGDLSPWATRTGTRSGRLRPAFSPSRDRRCRRSTSPCGYGIRAAGSCATGSSRRGWAATPLLEAELADAGRLSDRDGRFSYDDRRHRAL